MSRHHENLDELLEKEYDVEVEVTLKIHLRDVDHAKYLKSIGYLDLINLPKKDSDAEWQRPGSWVESEDDIVEYLKDLDDPFETFHGKHPMGVVVGESQVKIVSVRKNYPEIAKRFKERHSD